MNETSHTDVFIRNPTVTITTGLTTIFEIFAGLLKNDTLREAAIALVPIAVLDIVILLRNAKKEYEFKKGKMYYKEMIAELNSELNLSTTTKQRKVEITKQIIQHQKTLEKLMAENIKIIIN